MKKLLTIVFYIWLSAEAYSQTVGPMNMDKLKVRATEIKSEIVIDGSLNEDSWGKAEPISDFVQIEPYQGEPSQFKTQVFLLYDEENLYVGAYCQDEAGEIRVSSMERDFTFRSNDTFAVGIDGYLDKRNTVTFAVNPYGSQKDYLSYDDLLFDSDWNGLWRVRTSREDGGWFAEYAIPWKTLRYDNETGESQIWGINFVRMQRESNEISAWSAYPRSFGFNRADYFGELHEILPPEVASNIQINPYALVSTQKIEAEGEETSNTEYKTGGEIKWAVNPNTILDITFNTDFAQAEVDRQVNNIGRSSVFFPERRQFFLENASLFGAGLYEGDNISGSISIIPFFSRQVGLGKDGSPIPIDAGVRLVNRTTDHSFGVMAIRESSSEDTQENYITVGRYTKNIGRQNRLGGLVTSKASSDNTNLSGGIDGFFRINEFQHLNFMVLQSYNNTDEQYGNTAYASWVLNNNFLNAWFTQTYVGERFNSELDFVARENSLTTHTGLFPNIRNLPFKSIIRSYRPRVSLNWYRQASSRNLQERVFLLSPFWLELQNGGYVGFRYYMFRQHLQSLFTPLGIDIAQGDYNFGRYDFEIGSDPSAKISGSIRYTLGDYFDGRLANLRTSLSVRPIPHIFIKASFKRNDFEKVGTAETTKAVDLYTVESRFFLNPRIQLFGLYQRNTHNDSNGYNLKLAWEYNPLSYLYVVYNSNRFDEEHARVQSEQAIFKLSFFKQF